MALTDNLVSYWKLDESSGNASDSVGSNTLTNNNTVTYSAGKINNGATFVRASSQWLSRAYTADLNIGGGDFTVAGWVRRDGTTSWDHVVGMGWDEATANLLYVISISNVSMVFEWHDGAYKNVARTHTMTADTWFFFMAKRTGTTISLSVNDGTVATATGTLKTTTAGSFGIGRGGAGASGYLNGKADEIGIWTRALSASEITELYNAGVGLTYPFTTANTANFLAFF